MTNNIWREKKVPFFKDDVRKEAETVAVVGEIFEERLSCFNFNFAILMTQFSINIMAPGLGSGLRSQYTSNCLQRSLNIILNPVPSQNLQSQNWSVFIHQHLNIHANVSSGWPCVQRWDRKQSLNLSLKLSFSFLHYNPSATLLCECSGGCPNVWALISFCMILCVETTKAQTDLTEAVWYSQEMAMTAGVLPHLPAWPFKTDMHTFAFWRGRTNLLQTSLLQA